MSLQKAFCDQWLKAQTSSWRQTVSFKHCKFDWRSHSIFKACVYFSEALPPSAAFIWAFSAAVPQLTRLQFTMSSSYAAAISALITANTLNPPIKPRPRPSPRTAVNPKTLTPPSKATHFPTTAQSQPCSREALGSYDEQQENPADYGIGRKHLTPNSSTPRGKCLWCRRTLCCRWLLPCRDRRDFCRPLPSG